MRRLVLPTLVSLAAVLHAQVPPPPEGAPSTPALKRLFDDDGTVDRVHTGFSFADGPEWVQNALIFVDYPRSLLLRADGAPTIIRENTGGATDVATDRNGRLVLAQRDARQLARIEDGELTVVADRVGQEPLNGPTDLVISPDGRIMATDPPRSGMPRGDRAKTGGRVLVVTPAGSVSVGADDLVRPTGLALSADGATLYVSDAGRSELRAYPVTKEPRLGAARRLASIVPWKRSVQGAPDGLTLDADGRIYLAGPGGIWVLDRNGGRLGVIATPETPSACTFGDADLRTLYITARSSLYKVRMRVSGAR